MPELVSAFNSSSFSEPSKTSEVTRGGGILEETKEIISWSS